MKFIYEQILLDSMRSYLYIIPNHINYKDASYIKVLLCIKNWTYLSILIHLDLDSMIVDLAIDLQDS